MNMWFHRSKDRNVSKRIFRVASLFLYVALLLHVVLGAYLRGVILTDISILALGLLVLLFISALSRFLWPAASVYHRARLFAELSASLVVIVLFMQQQSLPALPLPWLVCMAGVFPLAISGIPALVAIGIVALTGFGLNAVLTIPGQGWFIDLAVTIFVGLLAIILAKALGANLSALRSARLNERRFEAIARATRHIYMITDKSYHIKYVNPAMFEAIGYTQEEIERLGIRPTIHPDDIEEHKKQLRHLRDTPRSTTYSRHRTRHKDGRWIWLDTRGFNMLHDAAIGGLVFSIEDISLRKNVEHKLAEEHALLRTVLDLNPAMIYAKDSAGRFTISNQSFQQQFGYTSEDELRGKTTYDLVLARTPEGCKAEAYEQADKLHKQDLQVIEGGAPVESTEIQGLWHTDSRHWFRTNKYPLRDTDGVPVGVLGIVRDITDNKEYETRLEHQALHDSLTGLPNRRYLLRTIAESIMESRQKQTNLLLMFCDLDFFKSVNDTHGHDFGDKCLVEMTRRILAGLPTFDFVARFGGDEFVVVSNGSLTETTAKADALLQAIAQPLQIDDVVVKMQASIGIALLHPDHKNPSDLIRDADAAMYQAKERGRDRAEVFDASLQNSATKRAQMDVALRFALERHELAVVYQPKISLIDGTVKGFELLVRWNSPQYGQISPNEFIPIAERSGLVVPIGLWVLEQACQQLSDWQRMFPEQTGLTIAVNVSMRQLLQSTFLSEVTKILEKTGVVRNTVELELTETSAMANPLQTIDTMSRLKHLGLRLALDDFGTGYSSLAYLQKLPIDVLKIDRAFVHGLGKNDGDAEIVKLILALAQTLHLDTVAEGVESGEHVAVLRKMGCMLAQGFLFSQPVSSEEAEQMIRTSRTFFVG